MSKTIAFISFAMAMLSSSVSASETPPVESPAHFANVKVVELQALDARSAIMARERICVAAAASITDLKVCRKAAIGQRQSLAHQLRPKFEQLRKSR